jgi:uncharacterized damage-inducible protein DinB
MAILDSVLAEMDAEMPATLRVLERVPMDKLDWTPHPKSSTLGKLAWHVAAIPARVLMLLRAGEFDLTTSGQAAAPQQPGDMAGVLRRNMDDVRAYFATISDDVLKEPFVMRAGPKVLRTMVKFNVVRGILLNHTYHHRGQLAVYLRLLDVPVPAIYGTSADENPFA